MKKKVINSSTPWKSRLKRGIPLRLLTVGALAVLFAVPLVAQEVNAGMIGTGDPRNSHPPMKPTSWHKLEGDVMGLDEVWGNRIKPRAIFEVPGGIGLLYNSKPPDPSEAEERGIAKYQTGSLAFTRNLVDWVDYPGNPILWKTADWQGSARAMPRGVLYDHTNEQWVVYFGDAGGDYEGIRAIGTAYSTDLLNWTIDPEPTMTVVDWAQQVAVRTGETVEAIVERREGRVYANWAIYHEGKYYLNASGFMFVSDNPGGPFELYEGFGTGSRPIYWDGMWYTVFAGEWDGQPGIGLAYASSLKGPFTNNPLNPIFTVETTSRARPQLLRYGGLWAVLYCHQHDTDTMPLRIAISHIHPKLLSGW
jgi:hypothetical protein